MKLVTGSREMVLSTKSMKYHLHVIYRQANAANTNNEFILFWLRWKIMLRKHHRRLRFHRLAMWRLYYWKHDCDHRRWISTPRHRRCRHDGRSDTSSDRNAVEATFELIASTVIMGMLWDSVGRGRYCKAALIDYHHHTAQAKSINSPLLLWILRQAKADILPVYVAWYILMPGFWHISAVIRLVGRQHSPPRLAYGWLDIYSMLHADAGEYFWLFQKCIILYRRINISAFYKRMISQAVIKSIM